MSDDMLRIVEAFLQSVFVFFVKRKVAKQKLVEETIFFKRFKSKWKSSNPY